MLAGSGRLPVLGMPGALVLELAAAAGRAMYTRGSRTAGTATTGGLLPRDRPGAVLTTDEIAARAVELATGCVDSVCVHGDTPGAVDHATRRPGRPGRRRVHRQGSLTFPAIVVPGQPRHHSSHDDHARATERRR